LRGARLLDSRPLSATVDGLFRNIGIRPVGSITHLTVNGRDGIPDDATAVALNLTAIAPTGTGYATVYPCSPTVPNTNNLSYVSGKTISNTVVAQVDSNGQVCIYTSKATHLSVDVNGYFPAT